MTVLSQIVHHGMVFAAASAAHGVQLTNSKINFNSNKYKQPQRQGAAV